MGHLQSTEELQQGPSKGQVRCGIEFEDEDGTRRVRAGQELNRHVEFDCMASRAMVYPPTRACLSAR